ncbi:MAG: hypothetical protein HQK75_10205 [Candidatus Magnetomorum sp.]|nr:hypothetical protein [Candidatus Magnetomorum sp.]
MLQMTDISTGFQQTFSPEQCIPLIRAFDNVHSVIHEQVKNIAVIQEDFILYKKGDLDRKAEIKKDLLIELATKADIKELNGKIDSLDQKMNGKIDTLEQKMNGKIDTLEQKLNGKIDALNEKFTGEFKNIRLWMKLLVGIAVLGIACFSPTAQILMKALAF